MRHDSHYVDELAAPSRTIGRKIDIDLIEPNPEQPRNEFGDLTELTESIKEKGVLEPLLVKPFEGGRKWMIIAGERRWRASKLAGLIEVPCIEMDLDEQGVAEIALIENLQRKDLNVWEEADGLAALADKFGYTQEQIAQKISKSRSTVTELMTIAGLPADIRERAKASDINTKSGLLEIARQFDHQAMSDFLDGLAGGKRSKPAKSKDEVPTKAKGKSQPSAASDAAFTYSPKDGSFTVEIRFKDPAANDRRGILKALKESFDAVKNSPS
jgi:ParB family transcriptional regulator, chromosome partitioning protein